MRTTTLATIVGSLLAVTGTAGAAQFLVQPTQIALAGAHHTGSITVTNRSATAVRFQVTAMTWREGEDGVMKLVPTEDLVVYPTLFTVDAGASRAVRVASADGPGDREIPYRIFVEELPPLHRADDPAPARITMLTRMGIPVFLPPATTRFAGDVTAELDPAQLVLHLRNRGTAHVRVATVRAIGEGADGAVVFDRSQAGWYLLAGGVRRYQLALAAGTCAQLTRIRIEAATDHGTWKTSVVPGAATCNGAR